MFVIFKLGIVSPFLRMYCVVSSTYRPTNKTINIYQVCCRQVKGIQSYKFVFYFVVVLSKMTGFGLYILINKWRIKFNTLKRTWAILLYRLEHLILDISPQVNKERAHIWRYWLVFPSNFISLSEPFYCV